MVEQVTGRDHVLNHLSIPAACFTHPEISMVGLTEVTLDPFAMKIVRKKNVLSNIISVISSHKRERKARRKGLKLVLPRQVSRLTQRL